MANLHDGEVQGAKPFSASVSGGRFSVAFAVDGVSLGLVKLAIVSAKEKAGLWAMLAAVAAAVLPSVVLLPLY